MQDMVNNGEYRFIHDTVLPTLGFINFKDTLQKYPTIKIFLSNI